MKQKDISSTTRVSILDAANRVMVDKGAEGFTLDAVAREAAISKGGPAVPFSFEAAPDPGHAGKHDG
jgi:DNA-binding transcriptional regulator YbjK